MKRYILTVIAFVLSWTGLYAESISVDNVTIEPGQTTVVGINLDNTATNLVSFQMDLTLPEGITINKAACSLSSRITDEDQELTIGRLSSGAIRLTSTSFSLTPISGTSGELISLSLTASTDSEGGTATISNIRFVTSNSEKLTLLDVTFNIIIGVSSPTIAFADANVKAICVANWDTNGDGELSEAEAAAVTDLGTVFKDNTEITSFEELQYFTGLTQIGASAFQNCNHLSAITIPDEVTSIQTTAFAWCSSLSSIDFGSGVTSLGWYVFQNCTNLKNINIPANLISIGTAAFNNCSNIESIHVEDGNTKYDSRNNCNAIIETNTNKLILGCKNTTISNDVTSIGNNAFSGCSGLTSVIIPEWITSIGQFAYSSCIGLTSIVIPNNVASIGASAFTSCNLLTDVRVDIEVPLSIDSSTFSNRANATLYVPYGCKTAYEAADYWKEFGTIVEMEAPAITSLSELSNYKLYTLKEALGMLYVNGNSLATSGLILDTNHMGLVSSVSQLSSPYTEPTEGSLEALLDNNTETFWHSIWTGGEVTNHTHYLQVELTESVSENICLQVTRRKVANDHITQWGVYGSNNANAADGDWEELASIDMPYGINTESRISNPFDTRGYRYLRFYIDRTTMNRGFGHLSEFRLFTASDIAANMAAINDEDCQFAILNINGKYYLYSPTKKAFWLAQGGFCPGFGSAVTISDTNASDDYHWTLTMPLNGQTVNLNLMGTPYKITPVAEFDPTEALEAFTENVDLGLSNGYYRIRSAGQYTNTVTDADGQESEIQVYKYMCSSIDSSNNSYGSWCTPEHLTTDLSSLWKLTSQNGYFDLQNMYTKGRFTTVMKDTRTEMSAESESLMAFDRITQVEGQNTFNIRVASQNMGDYYYLHMKDHAEGRGVSGNIVGWCNTGTGGGTEWVFEPVSDEDAALIMSIAIGDTFDAPVPCGDSTVDLTFKVTNLSPWEVEVFASPEDIAGALTIPSTVEYSGIEFAVKTIAEWAFSGRNSLSSVVIPASVIGVWGSAFGWCTGLTSVTYLGDIDRVCPNTFHGCTALTNITFHGVTEINGEAFRDCNSLQSITLPEGLTTIENDAFRNSGLESITFPSTLKRIALTGSEESGAFQNCESLETVTFNESLEIIGNSAFKGCTKLSSVAIPSTVTSIGDGAFWGCNALANLSVAEGNTTYDSRGGCNAIIETATNTLLYGCKNTLIPVSVIAIANTAFEQRDDMTTMTIPEGVTNIGWGAFKNTYISGIVIPSTTISIEDEAFYVVGELFNDIIVLPTTPPSLGGENVFYNQKGNIYVPNESVEAYKTAEGWSVYADQIKPMTGWTFDAPVPNNDGTVDLTFTVTHALPWEVEVSASPEDIAGALTIPSTVEYSGIEFAVKGIGYEAFQGKENITSVVLPEGLIYIKDRGFNACAHLSTASLPSTLSEIWQGAFMNCGVLSIINIPNGVTTISLASFQNTPALKSIELPEGITTIEYDAFRNSGLESITFPSTLREVQYNAFSDCKNLSSIDFNNCLATFDHDCFASCTSLESLYVPNTVKFIGYNNFWGCTSLKTAIFEPFEEGQETWSVIGLFNADYYTSALETVVLPSTSVMLSDFFCNCTSLKYVTFQQVEDDYNIGDKNFVRIFRDVSPDQILFTVPDGTAETLLRAGYMHLSDLSGLPLVREEFEAEATRIQVMANGISDGDKATLNSAISSARTAVANAEDYTTIYAQIAVIKNAAKTFLGTATLIDDFDVTAAYVSNSDFDHFQIGWKVYGGDSHRGWQGIDGYNYYANGEVAINNFLQAWRNGSVLGNGQMSQTITSLPAGVYRLECDAMVTWQYDANVEVTGVNLFAGTAKTAVATECQKPQHFTVEFTQYKQGDCPIGVDIYNTTANWVAMDNVRLYRLNGDVPAPVVDEEMTYYIQNVETGQYLHQGNSAGTHAVLKEDGLPVKITLQADGSYTICFLEGSQNDRLLFRDDESNVYVDYNSSQKRQCPYWTITSASEEGTYHIQSLVTDSRYGQQVYPGTYLGNNPTKDPNNDVDGNILDEEGMNITWRFVPESVYKNKIAMYDSPITMLANGKTDLPISLRNDEDIVMVEFYLKLPTGISIAENREGDPDCTLNSERSNGHALEVSQAGDGVYHFLVYSNSNNALQGNDGELVSVRLTCAGNVSPGDYEGVIRNILLSGSDNNNIRPASTNFTITVSDAVLGDVNDDGSINGLDVVKMVDHIMGREPEGFDAFTSDINSDGKINGVDLVKLVRLVMEQEEPEDGPSGIKAINPVSLETMTLESYGTDIRLGVESPEDFILVQCIVKLSMGKTLQDVVTDDEHTAAWLDLGGGRYSVLAYSTRNARFTDNTSLLTFRCSGEGSVSIGDVLLVDASRNGRKASNTDMATDIKDVSNEEPGTVYDLQGRKLDEGSAARKGVYIVNGKKVLVR